MSISNINFQNTNILENYYSDGIYDCILNTSINQFQFISAYRNQYLPNWQPNLKNSKNKLIFNSRVMFEINIYKNIITLMPIYINHYDSLEQDIYRIKSYIENYIRTKEKNNQQLLEALNTKLYVYIPVVSANLSYFNITMFPFNNVKKNISILNNPLVCEMYESIPIPICCGIEYNNNTPQPMDIS
jgi:hypothetical protein